MLLSLISTLVAVHFTSADYPCLCNYHVEKEMYQKPDIHAQPSGYLYEFDCKAIIQRPFPGLNPSWIAIAHEHACNVRQPYNGCPFTCNLAEITRNETVWRMRANNVKGVYYNTAYCCYGHRPVNVKRALIGSKVTEPTRVPTTTPTSTSTSASTVSRMVSVSRSTTRPALVSTSTPRVISTVSSTPASTASSTVTNQSTTASTQSTTPSTQSSTPSTQSSTPSTRSTTPSTRSTTPSTLSATPSTQSTTSSTKSATQTTKTSTQSTRQSTKPSTHSTTPSTQSTTQTTQSTTLSTRSTKPTTQRLTSRSKSTKPSSPSTTRIFKPYFATSKPTHKTTQTTTSKPKTTDWTLVPWSTHVYTKPAHHQIKTTHAAPYHDHTAVNVGSLNLCPNAIRNLQEHGTRNLRQHGQFCYELRTQTDDWMSASSDCYSYSNGFLVQIMSQQDQNFIMNFLKEENVHVPVWIGLNDRGRGMEEHFYWDSGARPNFTNWDPNRKDNDGPHGQEDCVILKPNGLWDDSVCNHGFLYADHRHPWICQYHIKHHHGG